jgi:general secretion pathway protein I
MEQNPYGIFPANRKAFTLIEVVLAMMIMASGLFILTNSWAGTYARLQKTKIQVEMAALLERKIVELEREFKGQPLDSIKEQDSGDFGSELDGYTWEMKAQKVDFPDLSSVIGGSGENQNLDLASIMKLFTEHLGKSVKEVKVTITHTKGKKPLSVDVTFYVIDYDKPLPMPGGAG